MKTKKAFTLIELLVVISIIALLLSILMPSLQKVKSLARRIVCASNLRQNGLAFALYANDNRECVFAYVGDSVFTATVQSWDSILAPYFSTKEKDATKQYMECPSDRYKRKRDPLWVFDEFRGNEVLPRSYTVNAGLLNLSIATIGPDLCGNQSGIPYKYTTVKRLQNTIHVLELHMGIEHSLSNGYGNVQGTNSFSIWTFPFVRGVSLYTGQRDQVGTVHEEGANWLFLSGHVEWHRKNPQAVVYTDQGFEGLEQPNSWRPY